MNGLYLISDDDSIKTVFCEFKNRHHEHGDGRDNDFGT